MEGLRAVAILLVVANHAWGWPAGGYVGVDVFFVVSGYLITRGLIRDRIQHGSVRLAAFYVKRVARLVPAAALVIAVTSALIALVYFPLTSEVLATQPFSSLFGVQNWSMVRSGADYLNPSGAPSPFQHFWSLSLEEQFYAIWPWTLAAVWFLAVRVRRGSAERSVRTATFGVVIVMIALSLAASVLITAVNPGAAYFLPVTRFWELGVGAAIAAAGLGLRGVGVPAVAMRWAGLAMIALSAVLYTPATPFPGIAALLPVAGTALVVLAAERADEPSPRVQRRRRSRRTPNCRPLCAPPSKPPAGPPSPIS
ncbi:lipopolysaccharide modification acyltransferase [Leifsonia xyli subsp. cynodontis DSM 46306]|uniref:Acyltransferase 3 domain-containing protein n=1 Tax=Leifsonia xyli subsp. cynodontis DSM 46306 TaxID=1389489 RepID=U3P4U5_LEIXC|nr:acyltransferase [Leifsonia xyli]AGW40796.1 lipopolysaccharide modification acyltransferase [Leifsonia xyli subsp. cynodontis DSM 46306]